MGWLAALRGLILFALGVACIVDALAFQPGVNAVELVIGLVLLGLVPVDLFAS